MINDTALRQVESNSASSKEFSIKNSSKMFNMIISGLYSDKPQSITREIWSNAYDAHCMVGKQDVPFVVSLPNSLMPTFVCRDFGPGIHHDDMEGFYTVLGHSTKEDTNIAVGKWGVGRMSPMSYTDTFSVTSYHKGMVAHYSVQLGADGAPALHTMSEPTPTTEPDGLEVSFPVQRKDLHLFERAAKLVSLGFDVKPTARGVADTSWPALTYSIKGGGWGILDTNVLPRGVYAKMGCVIYEVDLSAITDANHLWLKLPYSTTLLLEFKIGDLEVTASREGLQYGRNDPTSGAIKSRLVVFEKQLLQKHVEVVENAPSYFDALLAANNSRSLNFKQSAELRDTKWRGSSLDLKDVLVPIKTPFKLSFKSRYDTGLSNTRMPFSLTQTLHNTNRKPQVYISVDKGKDRDVRAAERIASHFKTLKEANIAWFKVESKDDATSLSKELKVRMGVDTNIQFVSGIPDAGPRVGSRTATTLKSVNIGVGSRSTAWDDYTLSAEDFDKGGVYLPISSNALLEGQSGVLAHVSKLLRKSGVLKSDTLIVVPKTHWKKFEESKDWKPLWEVATEFTVSDRDAKVAFASRIAPYGIPQFSAFCTVQVGNQLFNDLRKHSADLTVELWGLTAGEMDTLLRRVNPKLTEYDCSAVVKLVEEINTTYPLLKRVAGFGLEPKYLQDYVLGLDLLRNQQLKSAA